MAPAPSASWGFAAILGTHSPNPPKPEGPDFISSISIVESGYRRHEGYHLPAVSALIIISTMSDVDAQVVKVLRSKYHDIYSRVEKKIGRAHV